MLDVIEGYSWVDQYPDLVWTVSVINGRDLGTVVREFGGDPAAQPEHLTVSQAWPAEENFGKYFYLQVIELDDKAVTLENNGWSGDVPEIARRLSRDGGRFVSLYWSMTGVHRITEAVDGRVRAYFDPLSVGYPISSADLVPNWAEPLGIAPE